MRSVKLACGAILLVGVFAAVAAAQAPPPTVAVTAAPSAVTLPATPIAPGPTKFSITRSGAVDSFSLATLRPGYTADQLREVLSRGDEAGALALVFLEAGAALSPGAPSNVTVDLRPNVTYVAVSIGERSAALASFTTTAAPNGATAPAPDATIRMVDYGFRGPATLPRNGTIRVTNAGEAFHFTAAARIRSGVSARRAGRVLRTGNERAFGRTFAGEPVSVQDLISPGSTNDNEITFQRSGRYALVCFFGGHNRFGMYRIVRVR